MYIKQAIQRTVCLGSFSLLMLSTSLSAQILNNFDEPNTPQLISAFKNKSVHIVQFGDSHTAADIMTGALRTQLQQQLGDGGMGWGMPMYFSGQRLNRYGYDKNGWTPFSSRSQRDHNYTLGGFIAVPTASTATLTIKAKAYEQPQQIVASIRQGANDRKLQGRDAQGHYFELQAPVQDNTWQTVTFTAQLPFTITAQNSHQTAIGGWWAKNKQGGGAVVSALGINGAELSFWNRWNDGWKNELKTVAPELVVLAYGTNEAYNDNLDVEHYRRLLISKIDQIRQASPQSAIMLLSAPESLKNLAGQCGTRPIKLTAVQEVQQQVARQQKTLYWDWQQAMGGACSMKSWVNQGLGRRDGVHFSEAGYQKLGQQMAKDLLQFADAAPAQQSSQRFNSDTRTANMIQTGAATSEMGYARVCLEGVKDCKSIQF